MEAMTGISIAEAQAILDDRNLIAVGADPTVDPSALYDLRLVVKGGQIVHRF